MYSQLNTMQEGNNQSSGDSEVAEVKIKTPKRILHFSDGVLEEYSDEEDVTLTAPNDQNLRQVYVDPNTLSWGPWLGYKAWSAGSSALAVCDYLGENLAYFLGITTPKYWYEIEEYKRMQADKLEKLKETGGWTDSMSVGAVKLDTINTNQPIASV